MAWTHFTFSSSFGFRGSRFARFSVHLVDPNHHFFERRTTLRKTILRIYLDEWEPTCTSSIYSMKQHPRRNKENTNEGDDAWIMLAGCQACQKKLEWRIEKHFRIRIYCTISVTSNDTVSHCSCFGNYGRSHYGHCHSHKLCTTPALKVTGTDNTALALFCFWKCGEHWDKAKQLLWKEEEKIYTSSLYEFLWKPKRSVQFL